MKLGEFLQVFVKLKMRKHLFVKPELMALMLLEELIITLVQEVLLVMTMFLSSTLIG